MKLNLGEVAIPDSVTSIRQGAFLIPFFGVPLPPAQADIVTRINPQATRAGGASAVVEWLLHAPPGAFAGGEWKMPTLGPNFGPSCT